MEHILYSIQDYKILVGVVGFIFLIIETFIPVLPLSVIIVFNAATLGLWAGFLVSWTASSIGSIALFLLARKFGDAKFFFRFKNDKTQKFISWVKNQGFEMTFITYVCPFIPDFLITVTSGFSNMNTKNFIPGMLTGKFIMFLFISYVGHDLKSFFSNPIKVIIFALVIIVSFIIGKKINKRILKK